MAYRHVPRLSPEQVRALPASLNTKEVCGVLGMQMNTVQRLARQGRIPASKVGSRLLFSKSTICALAGLADKEAANE